MEVNLYSNETQYKKPVAGAIIGGTVAGYAVNRVVASKNTNINQKVFNKALFKMKNFSDVFFEDEFKQAEEAISNTLQKTGLSEKGVKIFKITYENEDEAINILKESLNNKFLKKMPKKFLKGMKKGLTNTTATVNLGYNTVYHSKSKNIFTPNKDLILSVFHEIGHAMNDNMSKGGKILQKLRPLSLLYLPISAIALLKTKKGENEKPKNNIDKTTTFIKNNAGKLTFAAFIPMLLEEGLASIKGNKFAKELLSPDLAKRVAKANAFGFSTYLFQAFISGVGIFLGVKVKDAIAKPKPVQEISEY
ncbi:MAG: hypothetical protein MJ229_07750 [bacterium]|nr:hypothetical protein [bacterium]